MVALAKLEMSIENPAVTSHKSMKIRKNKRYHYANNTLIVQYDIFKRYSGKTGFQNNKRTEKFTLWHQ